MAENQTDGAVMLPPAKTQESFNHIGFAKAKMTKIRAFVLAILAGAFVAMGAAFMIVTRAQTGSVLLGGVSFCLGLFLVLVAGAELFTGNCLMVIGALNGKYSPARMLRRWAIVYAGNLVGSLLVVALLVLSGYLESNDGSVGVMALSVASGKAALDPLTAFIRGILCNVLVCLAVWMGSAGKTVCDKLAAAFLPVVSFVAMGFEHSVANMFFLPLGFAAQAQIGAVDGIATIALAGVGCNLLFVTLGNIVGGVAIAAAYWFVYGRETAQAR